jgi:hypothetical protein
LYSFISDLNHGKNWVKYLQQIFLPWQNLNPGNLREAAVHQSSSTAQASSIKEVE